MASGFIKIHENFTLVDSDDADTPIVKHLQKDGYGSIDLNILEGADKFILFRPRLDEMVSGEFSVEPDGKKLNVKCNAIFKLSIKPDHLDSFLNPKSKWVFNGIADKFLTSFEADVEKGLESEAYKYKNRFGEGDGLRYLIEVKTATKVKDLS